MRTDLFRFEEGATIHTFTSGNREVIHASETYVPIPIGRSSIKSTQELSKASIEVSMSLKNTIAKGWVSNVIEVPIRLTVFTIVDSDPATTSWIGRLTSVKSTRTDAVLVINSDATLLNRAGLRKRFQRTCPFALYGKGCEVDETLFDTAGTITARADLVLTIIEAATQVDGFFTGGMIKASDGKLRYIVSHVGDQITISRDLPSLADTSVTLFAGCDRTRTDCNDKFDNLTNFGGFPFIPLKNPFGGTSIA
jgi:uncharacterized phage protein (TIGR02218 family)